MRSSSFESQAVSARWKPWLLGGAGALVLAAAFFSFRLISPEESLELDAGGRRLVVLPVDNATGEPEHDWVRLGVAELIAETLRRTRGVDVVAPERLVSVIDSRGLDPSDEEMRRRVRELGFALGAELVLDVQARRGTSRSAKAHELYSFYFEVGDQGGNLLAEGELRGAEPSSLAERLTRLVGGALAAPTQPLAVSRVFSTSSFANRLYGMGVTRLLADGPAAARPYFEIALTVQSSFLAARYRIAECARRDGLLDESRRLYLGMVQDAQDRGERVWEARALHALAVVEALAGRGAEATQLATQVSSHFALAEDPAARLAVLRDQARFSLVQGDVDRAAELYVEIGALQEELGDRLGRVDTLAQLGALALRAEDLEAAVAAFNEGRTLAAEVGDVRSEMQLLASLGEVTSRRGRHAEAVELWRRAATFYEQRGEQRRQLLLEKNVAEALARDDLAAAEEAFLDVRELAVRLGDESTEALSCLRLTWILLRRGYPYQARPHLDRAVELDRQLDQPLALQRMIAWMAYEEGKYELAHSTLTALERQAGEGWTQLDADFLEVFARALERGERLPVPGEEEGTLR